MVKENVLCAVREVLDEELRRQLAAQRTAAAGATHAEARAETKWDTCGLEQSYLARGHAMQVETLAAKADELRRFIPPCFNGQPIDVGALVETEMNGEALVFFLLRCGGGIELVVDGREITVITPESPVGAALMGQTSGDTYSFQAGAVGKIRRVQ